jgi:hypothetical protein
MAAWRSLVLVLLGALALAGRPSGAADTYDYGYDSYYDTDGGKPAAAKDDFG